MAATILHGMEQSNNEVKVTIEEVLVPYTLVHVPTYEVYTMAQAFQGFLVWPTDLVDSNSDPPPPPLVTNSQTHHILNFIVYMLFTFNIKL